MAAQMIRRPATGALQLTRNSLVTTRDFTSTCCNAEADKPQNESSPRRPAANSGDFSSRRGAAVRRVQDVFDRTSNSQDGAGEQSPRFTPNRQGFNTRSFRPNGPPGTGNRPGGPMLSMNSDQLKERLRQRANTWNRGSGGRGPAMPGASRFARNDKRQGPRDKRRQRRGAKEDKNEPELEIDGEIMAYQEELMAKEKRKPVRYNPKPYSVERLKETWPALATGGVSSSSTVHEKLSWFGESYVGCTDLPEDLAKRVYEGKRVLFSSETQKAETMEFVKKLASQHAEKLSQRKGETVEPANVEFENVSEKEKSDMIASLVRGAYDKPVKLDTNSSPILENVLRVLSNNHTYHTAHTQKFMDKLVQNLPLKKAKAAKANAP
ncbi:hypothetical protein MaudCBS49596_000676 [Microsporum audouinii]